MKRDNWLDDKAKAPDPDDLTRDGLPLALPGTTAALAGVRWSRDAAPERLPIEDASAPHVPPGESGHIRGNE
jgi:hypothetical protein